MSTTLVVGLAGSCALLVAGLQVAAQAAGLLSGNLLRAELWRWTGSRRAAFGAGLVGGAALPADEPRTRTVCGLGGSGLVPGIGASWMLLGGGLGGAALAWLALAFGSGDFLRLAALTGLAVGVAVRATVPGPRRAIGEAVAGASLIALGLQLGGAELARWGAASGYPGLDVALGVRALLGALAGAGLAALVRSGGLAAGLVALAASAELLHPASAISWLVGVPLGAALPALSIWRGGDAEARRVALTSLLHAGVAALATLALLLTASPFLGRLPGAFSDAGVAALVAYTLVQGVVVLSWAAFDRLVTDAVSTRVPDTGDVDEDPGRNLETVPELLRSELVEAVQRGGTAVRTLAREVLGGAGTTNFRAAEERAATQETVRLVEAGAIRLVTRPLPPELAAAPVELPIAARSQRRACEVLIRFRSRAELRELPLGSALASRLRQVQLAALHLVEGSDPYHRRFSPRELRGEEEAVGAQLAEVRGRLVRETARGALDPRQLEELLDRLTDLEALVRAAAEAGRALGRCLGARTHGLEEPESRPTAPPQDVEEPAAALPAADAAPAGPSFPARVEAALAPEEGELAPPPVPESWPDAEGTPYR